MSIAGNDTHSSRNALIMMIITATSQKPQPEVPFEGRRLAALCRHSWQARLEYAAFTL
jgi:hypothetical protein